MGCGLGSHSGAVQHNVRGRTQCCSTPSAASAEMLCSVRIVGHRSIKSNAGLRCAGRVETHVDSIGTVGSAFVVLVLGDSALEGRTLCATTNALGTVGDREHGNRKSHAEWEEKGRRKFHVVLR